MPLSPTLSFPLMAQLEITSLCNLRCLHCYHMGSLETAKGCQDLSDEKICELMQKLIDLKIFSVTWTGGEPLMKKPLLLKLCKMTENTGMITSLNTNLLLLDDEILGARIDSFFVSCPSSNPDTYKTMTRGGDYRRLEKNLQKLLAIRSRDCSINMVINKRNLSEIKSTATRMKDLGVVNFCASAMVIGSSVTTETPYLLSHDEIMQFIETLCWVKDTLGMTVGSSTVIPKCAYDLSAIPVGYDFLDIQCNAGNTTVQISSKGDVRVCPNSEDNVGNLFDESLQDIYSRMGDWRDGRYVPQECQECKALMACGGGCRVQAFHCTRKLEGKDPWMTKPLADWQCKSAFSQKLPELHNELEIFFPTEGVFWREESPQKEVCTIYSAFSNNHISVKKLAVDFLLDAQERFGSPHRLGSIAEHYNTTLDDRFFRSVLTDFMSIDVIRIQS